MEPVDTLVSARWVMPVEPDGRVLEHHSVAIRSGRIEAVLPTGEARLRYDAGKRSTGRTTCCCPGWSTPTPTPQWC
jgi:phage gp36-like protein